MMKQKMSSAKVFAKYLRNFYTFVFVIVNIIVLFRLNTYSKRILGSIKLTCGLFGKNLTNRSRMETMRKYVVDPWFPITYESVGG